MQIRKNPRNQADQLLECVERDLLFVCVRTRHKEVGGECLVRHLDSKINLMSYINTIPLHGDDSCSLVISRSEQTLPLGSQRYRQESEHAKVSDQELHRFPDSDSEDSFYEKISNGKQTQNGFQHLEPSSTLDLAPTTKDPAISKIEQKILTLEQRLASSSKKKSVKFSQLPKPPTTTKQVRIE